MFNSTNYINNNPRLLFFNKYESINIDNSDYSENELQIFESYDFANYMIDKLIQINNSINDKDFSGIYYASDILPKYGYDNYTIGSGMANSKYWNVLHNNCNFVTKDNIIPTEALISFFIGPTTADCGSVIMSCIYHSIALIKGSNCFNKIFGQEMSKFIISQVLFQKYSSKSKKTLEFGGNPLYDIFDKITNLTLNNLKHGDIVYIRGVKDYPNKHLAGDGQGWNLICIKNKTTNNKLKFIGFGNKFKNSLTYDELKNVLIESYNKTPNNLSKKYMDREFDKNDTSIECVKANLAKLLYNNTCNEIVGLEYGLRININKLKKLNNNLFEKKYDSWYNINKNINFIEPSNYMKNICLYKKFSVEHNNASFNTYKLINSENNNILNTCVNFASAVIYDTKHNINKSKGLILIGCAGIGKTHLAVSVAKHCAMNNVKVMYIDADYIEELYQKSNGSLNDFTDYFLGYDLIIIDDINSCYSIANTFYKQVLQNFNCSIMITSNNSTIKLSDTFSTYLTYDNSYVWNFKIIKCKNKISNRVSWISKKPVIKYNKLSIESDLIKFNFNKKVNNARCLVITGDNLDLIHNNISMIYKLNYSKYKIYYAEEAYKNQYVNDLYLHSINGQNKYDCIIMKFNSEQFIKAVLKSHDYGIDIILIDYNINSIKENILKEINKYNNREYKIRILDRLNIILPFML